ncbi:MAG TPA: TetR family transcriptional regulator C-terminal domain-containing protein [Baekduia sp.]|uniref:TetR/AcrR family transcriptional regulator n=1 Tax=Baekduia sp. TaxID=2600305 RepID=UPI002CE52C11|nr:TetR family transcriptional regulator C-terminal domain-containing protein [Baekduia sp.]HMJ36987.1 TetR family transcriptional regulator C-terminal domain-containing protein [Baekduia sp.]
MPAAGSTTERPPRGEARRTLITEAALAVIARVGPDGLTHRLVAAEAGLPVAATTYWFASKEDMVRAALEHAAERDLRYLDTLRTASRGWTRATLAAELAAMVQEACTTRRENAVVDGALWLEALRRPELRPVARRWNDEWVAFCAEVLRNVGARARAADAALLAASVDGLISHGLVADGPFDRAAVVAALRRLVAALTAE